MMTKKKLVTKKSDEEEAGDEEGTGDEEQTGDYEEKINNENIYDQSDDGVEICTYDQCDQGNDYTENYPPETMVITSSDKDSHLERWITVCSRS